MSELFPYYDALKRCRARFAAALEERKRAALLSEAKQ
jgi:hypothetical protein